MCTSSLIERAVGAVAMEGNVEGCHAPTGTQESRLLRNIENLISKFPP